MHVNILNIFKPRQTPPTREEFTFTGNCDLLEYQEGNPVNVGRCDYSMYNGVCPRHGKRSDYPDRDSRVVDVRDRDYGDDPRLRAFLGH